MDEEMVFYSQMEMKNSLVKNQWLLDTIRPLLLEMLNKLRGGNFDLLIFDNNLHLLEVLENPGEGATKRNRIFKPGLSYREEDVGITSVNLCIREGKAATVIGYEHYHKLFSDYYCIAVPLYDETGELMCVVGVAGEPEHYKPYHKEVMEISGKLISRHVALSKIQYELLQGRVHCTISLSKPPPMECFR